MSVITATLQENNLQEGEGLGEQNAPTKMYINGLSFLIAISTIEVSLSNLSIHGDKRSLSHSQLL